MTKIEKMHRRIRAGRMREYRLRKRLAEETMASVDLLKRQCASHNEEIRVMRNQKIDALAKSDNHFRAFRNTQARLLFWRLLAVAALMAGVLVGRAML